MRKLVVAVGLVVSSVVAAKPDVAAIRNSKFFKVDMQQKRVVAAADYIQPALRVDLTSVATDQPQYWPQEKVFLKVMALSRPGQTLSGSWQKRDAETHAVTIKLNRDGIGVIELLDGGKGKLELGEYRVQLKSADGKTQGSATFAVVDGALGAVSLAYEWKRVTTVDALEATPGAWFLGNAGGAGARWGNGLSFKNELRVANQPYNGHATINSRCMLPGCNGTFAGRTLERDVQNGKIEGTLDVGGHSGPFQIEIVTPQGSLRHQFEGSSHVERDMMVVSGGVGYAHRVGLAPYENTVVVPGRQLYVESKKADAGAFELASIIAKNKAVTLNVVKAVKHGLAVVWSPKPDGSYAPHELHGKGDLTVGSHLTVPVAGPYALVTIGGFVDGKFTEGWAVVFAPSELEVAIDIAPSGIPNQSLPVAVKVSGGGKISGILEVYDNRVASRSPFGGLASAIGDSVRATSQSVASWSDTTGLREEESDSPHERYKNKKSDDLDSLLGSASRGGGSGTGMGYGSGQGGLAGRSAAAPMKLAAPPPPPPKPGQPAGGNGATGDGENEAAKEIIREGEKKVVACVLLETDADGKATTTVTLPPQTGRVVFRFVAAKGLDHAEAEKPADVKLPASVEARLPGVLMQGAEMKLQIDVTNTLPRPVQLVVSGAGVAGEVRRPVGSGHEVVAVPLAAQQSGKLVMRLTDEQGTPLDRREVAVNMLDDQTVTYSRLEFGGGAQGVVVAPDEDVVVYDGAGPLLGGVVMNMFTTSESWFGHAEALSAKVAVDAVLLAATKRGLIGDDGLTSQLRSRLNASLRALDEQFCDKQEGLCRPYPGLATNVLWSAWVGRNLHAARRALDTLDATDGRVVEARALVKELTGRIDKALAARKQSTAALGGYDEHGDAVIPVEIDGKVVYRVLTDDAVSRWAVDKLLPKVDLDAKNTELGFGKAYDAFRFLKAFERVGALQYLTDVATALYLKGEREKFARLYRQITRGMILTQEPGLLQGPALLGGVYSTPMAMVRFLELQLAIGKANKTAGRAHLGARELGFGEHGKGGGTLTLPAGAIARVDKRDRVRWTAGQGAPMATVTVSADHAAVGGELGLELSLSSDLDPTEYYALVAVPSTVAIKQTADILSDYKGQVIYGQQVTGGTRMQLLAVPFRGARSMKLLLEGAYPGHSPGRIAIRHIEKSDGYSVAPIRDITVE